MKQENQGKLELNANSMTLKGVIDKFSVPPLWLQVLKERIPSEIEQIDVSAVESVDSAGVLFVEELAIKVIESNSQLQNEKPQSIIKNIPKELEDSFRIFSQEKIPQVKKERPIGYFERLGDSFYVIRDATYEALVLTADILYWSIVGLWKRKGARKGSFIQQSILIGVDSVPIVFLLSFIIGLILSLQSAVQLRMFGANIFVADLITVAMLREMGPMMTAIIIAGRSGSAIASEIATMKVTEELDALKMMAMNPIRYVVVPKFHAITICMPLLVVISIIVGILGGVIVAVTYLNVSPTAFYNQMLNVLALKDLLITLLKSTIFAWAIVIIGSFYGFRVQGGAEGVGKATTLSVVASIFAVIVIDVIFSLLYLPS